MMLRNLIDEVRNRRVLAFGALAVLVAVALPLLFLKSAPEGAPAANTAAPAPAKEAKLPPRAARLLATTDPGAPGGRAKGSAQDPFSPPASYRNAAAAAAAKLKNAGATASVSNVKGAATSSPSTPSSNKPIPVVIKNAPSKQSSSPSSKSRTSKAGSTRTIAVDIRFGKKKDSKLRRSISRNQGFYIHGKLVAMFVKYSPSRKKAIFAVAPGLHISGSVTCRVENGQCRYLDMPVGSHAYITMITANRTIVKRRLDVVHARSVSTSSKATPAAVSAEAACLLSKLTAMKPGDRLLDRDACEL
jgi:hypothetical protein